MSHCFPFKAVHPEELIGVSPFLLFWGFCLWHHPVARSFLQWPLSNHYHRSLFKAAHPKRLASEVPVNPGASPSSEVFLFSTVGTKQSQVPSAHTFQAQFMLTVLVGSSSISEVADSSTTTSSWSFTTQQ
jgi:hypothetical protein